jgi:hypothetical protein
MRLKMQQVVRTPEEQEIIDYLNRDRSEPLSWQLINLGLMQAYAIGLLDQEPSMPVEVEFAAPESGSKPDRTASKRTTPKKTTSESSLTIPADEDVTSEELGTIFAIVGVQPSKPKE